MLFDLQKFLSYLQYGYCILCNNGVGHFFLLIFKSVPPADPTRRRMPSVITSDPSWYLGLG